MPRYWIVTCLDSGMVGGGLWVRWYEEKCVAIGWSPDKYALEGPTGNGGWKFARTQMKKIRIGDKVIPFLKKWRIGPVGIVTAVRVADDEWNPTLLASERKKGKGDDFGRRISVKWQEVRMPNDGRVALIPKSKRPDSPFARIARHTVEELSPQRFHNLCSVLSDPANWIYTKKKVPTA